MAEILYAPNRERVVTTNAWAFLHWLRTTRGIHLADWAALQRYSVGSPGGFSAAVAAFAELADTLRHPLPGLPCYAGEGVRVPYPLSRVAGEAREGVSPTAPVSALADVLLHADIRPNDRLLVSGPAWPWRAAELVGATVIAAAYTDLLAATAEERATVLMAPATSLAEAAFQRPRRRPDLAALRTIIATGGPLSPEGRRRIYTWVKSDLMLLASTGDTYWGNPLEPVLAQPRATPAFLTPPPSGPATR